MLRTRVENLNGEWKQVERAPEFLEYLHGCVGERRVVHSISVTQVLYVIAGDLALDRANAVAAGLLHDSCKGLKNDAMLEKARDHGIAINAIQMAKPNLLHGYVAAAESQARLGVDSPEVYEAIFWHVTGRAGLGLLGQALFFADFAEPLRRHPMSDKALSVYDNDGFDAALCVAAEGKLAHLAEKGAAIDPQTQAFHNWLLAGKPQ